MCPMSRLKAGCKVELGQWEQIPMIFSLLANFDRGGPDGPIWNSSFEVNLTNVNNVSVNIFVERPSSSCMFMQDKKLSLERLI